ncbi:MAG: hypothetical protein QNJ34_19990 [Xenococcaceae cyanobacterium MO_188.B29]|nr:hypothetical protein [Xenococcaceae cyanobacterium MO_188.B29]
MISTNHVTVVEKNKKIIDVIVGIANAVDKKNWQKLRKYLADEINVDYSEFILNPVQKGYVLRV